MQRSYERRRWLRDDGRGGAGLSRRGACCCGVSIVLFFNSLLLVVEKIRGKICRLGSTPALLRRLGPCVTKEELESLHQKIESVTRIFEKMLLFFFFKKK